MAGSSATIATWDTGEKNFALETGVSLKAAGLVAASAAGTAIEVGKGLFMVKIVVSAIEVASNNELYNIDIEANTRNATSTYKRIAQFGPWGAAEVTGRNGDDSTDTYIAFFENPYDYQIRVYTHVVGSVATGINYVATVHTVPPLGAIG